MAWIKNLQGYTLIELLVIVLVIGILAGALFPFSLEAVNKSELEAAAKMIASDIRYGQNKALTQQAGSFKIQFLPGDNEYRTFFDKDDIGEFETVEMAERVTLSGVKFGDFDAGGDHLKLYLNARGTVMDGGKVSLHDEAGNWLFVLVAPITGRVRISETGN